MGLYDTASAVGEGRCGSELSIWTEEEVKFSFSRLGLMKELLRESLPWQAFLTPSVPNMALIELGASIRAI